jgi:hypothetical protein
MSRWPRWPWSPESPRTRAKSPSRQQLIDDMNKMAEQERSAIMHESARTDAMNEEDRVVDDMIEQISRHIPMDRTDQRIRFIIKKIISVHGLTQAAIEKIQRCRPLLSAISDAIGPNIEMLQSVMRGLPQQTASLAARGAEFASIQFSNGVHRIMAGRHPPPQGRGARSRSRSPSPLRLQAALQIAPTDFVTMALSGLYHVLSGILNRAIQSCKGGACTALTRLQALYEGVNDAAQAAPAAPAAAAPAECAICMGGSEYGPLGYVQEHNPRLDNPATGYVDRGHPNEIHQSCLRECRNRCPMCRADGPVWGTQLPPGQGGGGLKRYRSKSKSRSRSRSRRYISKPRKSRKARKRIRHSSSRRK